jgi:outer membrane receptor protein involved in Fe transport
MGELVLALALALGDPSAATLTGSVVAADGTAIAGASVIVRQDTAPRSTVTDAAGAFSIDDVMLPAVVEVRAPGFAAASRLVEASPAAFRLSPAAVVESIIVEAERASAWRDPATGTTVLAREDLDRVPALTLDEGVRVISGFSLFRRSSSRQANPTTHGVTMRGLAASGASRGLVLMDGVPLNDGFGGWVTWTRVPPPAVGRVEIDRGPAGDAFGSDALGGVIRIQPPSMREPAWEIRGESGSHGLGTLDALAGDRTARGALFGATRWLETDGTIPVEPDARGDVDRPTDVSLANAYGRAELGWAGRRLSVAAWGGRDDRGNGTVAQRNRMSGATTAVSFDAAAARTTFAARLAVSPNDYYQTFSAVLGGRDREILVLTQNVDTLTTRGIVEVGHSLPDGHVLVRGTVSRASADFEEIRSSGTTFETLSDRSESIAVQAGLVPSAGVTLGAGLRHERRAAPTSADGREGATIGRVRAAWRPETGNLEVRASAATSHRWPTLNELVRGFRVGDVVTLANLDLLPERAASIDGALTMDGPRWQASVGGFWTRVDDAIANVTLSEEADGILRQRQNAGRTRARGVEIDAELRPGGGSRIRTSATFVDARFVDAIDDGIDGNRLPQVPRAAFTLAVEAPLPERMAVSAVLRALSPQFDDDRNRYELASATQLDVRLTGRAGRVGWHIVVENVFDAAIEVGRTPLVTLAPPRSVRVGRSVGSR